MEHKLCTHNDSEGKPNQVVELNTSGYSLYVCTFLRLINAYGTKGEDKS